MSMISSKPSPDKATEALVDAAPPPVLWNSAAVAVIAEAAESPLLTEDDVARISDDLDIWDAWPVQDMDGTPSRLDERDSLWMALGAPRFEDPDERHGHARIHLLLKRDGKWLPLGPAMPDGFSPGSREWSGSAVLDQDGSTLTLYFTAAGYRGENELSFTQRIYAADATLKRLAGGYGLCGWHGLREIVMIDHSLYMPSDGGGNVAGTIKAFRDPAYFHDPVTGLHHIFFAASLARSLSQFNGVIGTARSTDTKRWAISPPVFSADRLNNELERPHVIGHAGRYYLFWSTQRHVFDPAGPTGPTGLYGAVADTLTGNDWRLLNGSGLVFMNPSRAPRQAYSWLVLPDLSVVSFIDDWGIGERFGNKRRFGATFAPELRLWLDGERAGLAQSNDKTR